jgi:hypothetical protein
MEIPLHVRSAGAVEEADNPPDFNRKTKVAALTHAAAKRFW